MATLGNNVFDQGLSYLATNGSHLYICSQEPTTYTEASDTYALGVKATPNIAAPSDRGAGGRECVVSAISDGTVSATGTATHYAIVYATGTELLVTGALNASQAVTASNPFTLTQFSVGIPDPA